MPDPVALMDQVVAAGEHGQRVQEAAIGDGPIDALLNGIMRITRVSAKLRDYRVHNVSSGTDSQGEAKVEVEFDGRRFVGRATSTDIIEASARAFVNVINRILAETQAAAARQSVGT